MKRIAFHNREKELRVVMNILEAEPGDGQTSNAESKESKTPGFGALVAFSLILLIWYLQNRSDGYE